MSLRRSSRRWSGPACGFASTAPRWPNPSMSTATCGRRSCSIFSPMRSSSPSRVKSQSRCGPVRTAVPPRSRCATPVPALRRSNCRGCSNAFIASKAPAAAASKAAASGSRWCRSWSGCTAAGSPSTANRARAAGSPSRCHSVPSTCRAQASTATRSRSRPRFAPRPICRKLRPGSTGGGTHRIASRPRGRRISGGLRSRMTAVTTSCCWRTTIVTCGNTSNGCWSRPAIAWRRSATAKRRCALRARARPRSCCPT